MGNELGKEKFDSQIKYAVNIGPAEMKELDFTSEFSNFIFAIQSKLEENITQQWIGEDEHVKITKFTWDPEAQGSESLFEIEYVLTKPYPRERFENAYARALKRAGCSLVRCEFSKGDNQNITLLIDAPDELKRKLRINDLAKRDFERKLKSSGPSFSGELHCIFGDQKF